MLLEAIEALYPMLALIHVFLDNARYQSRRVKDQQKGLGGAAECPLAVLGYAVPGVNH
jgi:hypothetical protein